MTEPGDTGPDRPEDAGPPEQAGVGAPTRGTRAPRKQVLLRLDPAVHDALAVWAAGELRSTNAQIEFLLRRALADAGRLPSAAKPIPRRGRPPRSTAPEDPHSPA